MSSLARYDVRFAAEVAQIALRQHVQFLCSQAALDFIAPRHAANSSITRADNDCADQISLGLNR